MLHGNLYSESHFPLSSLMPQRSSNVIQLSDPCFGLAVSPGNLIIAVVHTLDPEQLDPMYEAKSRKAAVEFLWITGRPLDVSYRNNNLDSSMDHMADVSEKELVFWKWSLFQSLKLYENANKQLVIWDVLFALMLLKQQNPNFVDSLLSQWLTGWLSGSYSNGTVQSMLSCLCGSLSALNIRKLHLLNIICRKLMLAGSPGVGQNGVQQDNGAINHSHTDVMYLWEELGVKIEREIRERVVAFAFKAFLNHAASPTSFQTDVWLPSGIAQMERWACDNLAHVSHELKVLTSKISGLGDRVRLFDGYRREETCDICSAVVPFESPEVAYCRPENSVHNSAKRQCLDLSLVSTRPCTTTSIHSRRSHELRRCSATMQICSMSQLWHCACCRRSAEQLLPEEFFTTTLSPLDVKFSSDARSRRKPCCPFCGVLLQRFEGFSVSTTAM